MLYLISRKRKANTKRWKLTLSPVLSLNGFWISQTLALIAAAAQR
jgi:hypothetical protein